MPAVCGISDIRGGKNKILVANVIAPEVNSKPEIVLSAYPTKIIHELILSFPYPARIARHSGSTCTDQPGRRIYKATLSPGKLTASEDGGDPIPVRR